MGLDIAVEHIWIASVSQRAAGVGVKKGWVLFCAGQREP